MHRHTATRRWPDHPGGARRPRVLVEYADDAVAYSIQHVLEAEGYEAAVCPGPGDLPGRRCPLAVGKGCELAEGADIVVNGLELTDAPNRAVLRALQDHRPGMPVVVEVPLQRRERYAESLEDVRVLPFPMTRESLLRAVQEALPPP